MVAEDPELANSRGCRGQTPLQLASTVEICEFLLDNGADMEIRDIEHRSSAIQLAFENLPKLRCLVGRGAKPDIYTACILGDMDLAKGILSEQPNALTSRPGFGEFKAAGHHAYLFRLGRPLSVARKNEHAELVDYLLTVADPKTKLIYHCEFADEKAAREIVDEYPGIVDKLVKHQMQTICECAFRKQFKPVKLMIELGFDLEVSAIHGTPLAAAAHRGAPDIVKLLLDNGASRTALSSYNKLTPFQHCVEGSRFSNPNLSDHVGCVKEFFEAGEPVPAVDNGSGAVIQYMRSLGAL
jgi:ankyrin repeat protein